MEAESVEPQSNKSVDDFVRAIPLKVLRSMYVTMLRIHLFEERVAELIEAG